MILSVVEQPDRSEVSGRSANWRCNQVRPSRLPLVNHDSCWLVMISVVNPNFCWLTLISLNYDFCLLIMTSTVCNTTLQLFFFFLIKRVCVQANEWKKGRGRENLKQAARSAQSPMQGSIS